MDNKNDLDLKRQAMLQHQANINAANEKLGALQNTLAQNENALAALIAEKPNLEKLNQQYEDALAAAATGETDDADHTRLATEIETAKAKLAELDPEIESRKKTIAGLLRKITEQQQTLSALRKDSEKVIRHFLLAESDAAGQRYLEHARLLIDEWRRLEGLSLLLLETGHLPALSPAGHTLTLPAYELPAFEGKRVQHNRNAHFETRFVGPRGYKVDFAKREANLLRSVGIDFDPYMEQPK